MKPFDSIERIYHSSAFGTRHTFFRFRSVSIPVKRIVPIATTFPHLPSFLSRRDKLFFLAVSFVAPWRRGPRDPRWRILVTVCTHRKRTSLHDSRRSGCLSRLINSTTRNKGLRHNKTRCLRIARISPSQHPGKFRDVRDALVMLCKI